MNSSSATTASFKGGIVASVRYIDRRSSVYRNQSGSSVEQNNAGSSVLRHRQPNANRHLREPERNPFDQV